MAAVQSQCSNCVYYNANDNGGACHRNPPQLTTSAYIKAMFSTYGGTPISTAQVPAGVWPPVAATSWCGEFALPTAPATSGAVKT